MIVSEQESIDASEQSSFQTKIDVTFENFQAKKDGAFLFKFEIPVTQMGYAMQSALFANKRQIATSVELLDEESSARVPIEIGVLTFEKLVFNRGGDAVLTLRGEQLEKMSMKSHEIRELLDKSMVIHLREHLPKADDDDNEFSVRSLSSLLAQEDVFGEE